MSVIIYSTPTCHYCHRAKDYLKEKKVEFTDIDVSVDTIKAQEMVDKSGQMGVPVLDINGTLVIGFDKAKIDQLLGL